MSYYNNYNNRENYNQQNNNEEDSNEDNNQQNNQQNMLNELSNKYGRVTVSLKNKKGLETYENVPIWKLTTKDVEELIKYEWDNNNNAIVISMLPENKFGDEVLYIISLRVKDNPYMNWLQGAKEKITHVVVDKSVHELYKGNINDILKKKLFVGKSDNYINASLGDKTLKHSYLEQFNPPFEYTLNTSVKGGRSRKSRHTKSKNKNKKRKTNKRRH